MEAAVATPVAAQPVRPVVENDSAAQNPSQTRYGWLPFGDVNLVSPGGSPWLYVQDHRTMTADGQIIDNPLHRILPRGCLLPFPTFNAVEMADDPERRDNFGRPIPLQQQRVVRAMDAVVLVARHYSDVGFTILSSLQGVDFETAQRIFEVVQPFIMPLGTLMAELENADVRIESTTPLSWMELPEYIVQPLQNEQERAIAYKLQAEMIGGATIAIAYAEETLGNTEISITSRLSGGQGKTHADPLDKRLSHELGHDLPRVLGTAPGTVPAQMGQQLDFLTERAKREDSEKELADLRAENARLKAAAGPEMPKAPPAVADIGKLDIVICGAKKADGEECKMVVAKLGDRCKYHPVGAA